MIKYLLIGLLMLIACTDSGTGGDGGKAEIVIVDGFLEQNTLIGWNFTTTLKNEGRGSAQDVFLRMSAYNQAGRRISQESDEFSVIRAGVTTDSSIRFYPGNASELIYRIEIIISWRGGENTRSFRSTYR